ncbi:hypothetical protein [Nocardia callitridis]|uniref:Uncharacterized protein n=1 Tax=Nocardia callitridis TaxID=648753 RepID=A0ABP9L4B0_9NOCA
MRRALFVESVLAASVFGAAVLAAPLAGADQFPPPGQGALHLTANSVGKGAVPLVGEPIGGVRASVAPCDGGPEFATLTSGSDVKDAQNDATIPVAPGCYGLKITGVPENCEAVESDGPFAVQVYVAPGGATPAPVRVRCA